MNKILLIIFFTFLSFNNLLSDEKSAQENSPIYYNEPTKRIYILWDGLREKDHFEFIRYVKQGAESVFVNYPGGYGARYIVPLIEKYKLPVFVGSNCMSNCTIISLRSPNLYASENTGFWFHNPRSRKEDTAQRFAIAEQWLVTEYRKSGATEEFIDLIKEERKKDTSKFSQDWNFWLTCDQVKKYFTKNKIFCDSVTSAEGINFIIDNHPNLKKFYCSNDSEKRIVIVFFNPSCPINYTEIKKENYDLLINKYSIMDEEDNYLNYKHDFGKLDMLLNEIGKLSEAGITFDFDEISKKHGFKSFKAAVSEYKKKFKVKIKEKQAKEYFTKVDQKVEINTSQENLDRLYDNLINNKIVRKRSTYFKEKKAKPNKALSACIDLKKELAKLTKDPKSKSPELYVWGAKWNMETTAYAITGAIKSNIYWIEKQKIPKSSCDYLIVDLNGKNYLTEDYVAKLLKK